jgi:cation:H+ antiporter
VLLVLGSHLLVENAVIIAKTLGVSDAVIGLTIVAFGTSMPELATSVVAALRKEGDIALGNIVGSNIFNLLAILGISGATFSYSCAAINAFDLYMMIGISLLLVPMLFTHTKLSRWEGLVLLLFYGIYLSIMWPR